MKILLYTDLHCSRTSSILPLYNKNSESKYTLRLQYIIDTLKWMYDTANEYNVDCIFNLGDTFDNNILKSEEITAMSDAFSYSSGIQEYHILGNHEILDTSNNFYANALLDNFSFIKVVDSPTKLDDNISLLPYINPSSIDIKLLKSLQNKFLLAHIDIDGMHLRDDFIIKGGVKTEFLSDYFSYVLNGHMHAYDLLKVGSSNIMNIGSVTSISFSDSNTYVPSIKILDTSINNVNEIISIQNPHSILFRKYHVDSLSQLLKYDEKLDKRFKYVMNVVSPQSIRSDIKEFLSSKNYIVSFKITTDISKNSHKAAVKENIDNSNKKMDIKDEYKKFLRESDVKLKSTIDKYIEMVDSLEEKVVNE